MVHAIATALALAALALWLGATVLGQLETPLARQLRRRDVLGLVPDWRFFAPRPVRFDYHLLYRDRCRDGACTAWTELYPPAPRPWWSMLWHPAQRYRTPIEQAAIQLLRLQPQLDRQALEHTAAHVLLWQAVIGIPRTGGAGGNRASVATQFLITASYGADQRVEPRLRFESTMRALRPDRA